MMVLADRETAMQRWEAIQVLTKENESRIRNNPLLNIDTFIIPSPFIYDPSATKDYQHSYTWIEEGEILGYLLTYSSSNHREYLIYKLVTSPYGRGRGIGSTFIENLAREISEESNIYLYVWEKQHDTVEFFRHNGFEVEDSIVYRNMVYYRLSAISRDLLKKVGKASRRTPAADEIGRTRHDARKTLSSLMAMINALAPENAGRIIEDINRETTTLINMLNMYRDSVSMAHEVNLQELILERLVPYVNASQEEIELSINLLVQKPVVLGHWLNIGRALVNLASNSIDAMTDNEEPNRLNISLYEDDDGFVKLRIADNGSGIPQELLARGPDNRPAFIGKSTKADGKGEGLGTAQVWSSFGPNRLEVHSEIGKGTEWIIKFERSVVGLTKRFSSLQRRFFELQGLEDETRISDKSTRTEIVSAIWRVRKKEIFLFELLEQFSHHHNIRDLYRIILSYFHGNMRENEFEIKARKWKGIHQALNRWLSTTAKRILRSHKMLATHVDMRNHRDALFKSYGQSIDKVIIFTLNPGEKTFLATDRKLAEHLDFVPYLGGDKDSLLRGEFVGDVNIDSNPIYLGVWSVDSDEDLKDKLLLLQKGAQTILEFGIHPAKRLAFYQSTYIRYTRDIDSDTSSTFGEFATLSLKELEERFVRTAESEMQGFITALD
ncbi:Topoisomerase IV subunit B [Olavius algarvensis spirochete endosymbiont]|uniref:GNAT family N-acetyltransferase n=1 Tax=Olavius algarvensis spirochete endosymbiont TaxID=260710 RepID=UPI000F25C65F|nr:GNAT family N-acetyltransferase [Olavius algarvensis spirochete endosymbiont]VDB00107.1 Topoisomerase IV subunit B [Olavius algarvensis spirochete endosymbiont]